MNEAEYGRMHDAEDAYWWFVARRELALGFMPKDRQRTLDLGCGTGVTLGLLQGEGWAAGLDFSVTALDFCRARGLKNLVQGDGARLPFASDAFDAVITLDTVEHIEDHRAVIAEIFRVLRPGAVVVTSVPAYRWLWGPHDVALMHFRRYSRGEFARLLSAAGFEVERASYSVFLLFPCVLVVRLLDRLFRRSAEVRLPALPGWLNRLLIGVMRFEGALLRKMNLPWGSSVIAVARKPNPPRIP